MERKRCFGLKVNKKIIFLFFCVIFSSVFCYAQNLLGRWEVSNDDGAKLVLVFTKDNMDLEFHDPYGNKTSFSQRMGMKPEYFVSDNILIIFGTGGTGIYAELSRYECRINGNTLALIALNASARVSGLEGRYTRVRR